MICNNQVSFIHSELVEKGRISYLVIETSGITDPRNIIQILDQNFGRHRRGTANTAGKMYYIRLDCVVTVIDADLLLQAFKDGEDLECAARSAVLFLLTQFRSQIINSDVILLNKIDLVEATEIEKLVSQVREMAPTSSIHPTKYSEIPLPFILDIQDQSGQVQAVSHDRTHVMYQISKQGNLTSIIVELALIIVGKSHRKEKIATQPNILPKNHVHAHNFNNLLVESNKPIVLWKFQEFLKNLSAQVVRVKGMGHSMHLLIYKEQYFLVSKPKKDSYFI